MNDTLIIPKENGYQETYRYIDTMNKKINEIMFPDMCRYIKHFTFSNFIHAHSTLSRLEL